MKLFKMKELNEIALGKRIFIYIKGQFCLKIGHLGYQKGHMEVKYPPYRKLFLTLLIQIKKKLFFKNGIF